MFLLPLLKNPNPLPHLVTLSNHHIAPLPLYLKKNPHLFEPTQEDPLPPLESLPPLDLHQPYNPRYPDFSQPPPPLDSLPLTFPNLYPQDPQRPSPLLPLPDFLRPRLENLQIHHLREVTHLIAVHLQKDQPIGPWFITLINQHQQQVPGHGRPRHAVAGSCCYCCILH